MSDPLTRDDNNQLLDSINDKKKKDKNTNDQGKKKNVKIKKNLNVKIKMKNNVINLKNQQYKQVKKLMMNEKKVNK